MVGRGRSLLGKYATALPAVVLLASCGPLIPPGHPPEGLPAPAPTPPPPANAIVAGVAAGPAIASYGIAQAKASAALATFQQSCPQLLRRQDVSGLTVVSANGKPYLFQWGGGKVVEYVAPDA